MTADIDRDASTSVPPTSAPQMRAIVADRYGEPEDLALEPVARPAPQEGEVRVRVAAAGVNPGDWYLVRGDPYLIRISGFGFRRPKARITGQDVAGVVESVGPGVSRLQPGDEVFGFGTGTYAEYAAIPESQLQPKPPHLTLEQAAVIPVAGLTAHHAVIRTAGVEAGQRVLVVGASGGVGQFAVQLAKARGAEVTGVCSTRNVERVRGLGADHVIDYTSEDFTAEGRRYDVIVRVAGSDSVHRCRRALTRRGTLVIIGGPPPGRWLGGMDRLLGTMILNLFTRQRLRPIISIANGEDLASLTEIVAEHEIAPLMDRSYPLEETPDALTYVGAGHSQGKVVITM